MNAGMYEMYEMSVESCSLSVLADGYEKKTREQEDSLLLIPMV